MSASSKNFRRASFRALNGFLPILCQPAASAQPCEGALHHPSSRQDFEALGTVGPFHDLDGPAANADQRLAQFRPGIAAIGEDMAQLLRLTAEPGKDAGSAVTVLNVRGVNIQREQVTAGVGEIYAEVGDG